MNLDRAEVSSQETNNVEKTKKNEKEFDLDAWIDSWYDYFESFGKAEWR